MPGSIVSALPETLRLTIRCALTADAMRARRLRRSVQRVRTVMKLIAPLDSTGKAVSSGRYEAPAPEIRIGCRQSPFQTVEPGGEPFPRPGDNLSA
jgi:hypothetical protein